MIEINRFTDGGSRRPGMAGFAAWLAAGFLTIAPASAAEAPAGVDPVFATWRAKADPAVESALGWLRHIQQPDGSFPENYGDSTGIPALAGMAFLSKGHLPTEGSGPRDSECGGR